MQTSTCTHHIFLHCSTATYPILSDFFYRLYFFLNWYFSLLVLGIALLCLALRCLRKSHSTICFDVLLINKYSNIVNKVNGVVYPQAPDLDTYAHELTNIQSLTHTRIHYTYTCIHTYNTTISSGMEHANIVIQNMCITMVWFCVSVCVYLYAGGWKELLYVCVLCTCFVCNMFIIPRFVDVCYVYGGAFRADCNQRLSQQENSNSYTKKAPSKQNTSKVWLSVSACSCYIDTKSKSKGKSNFVCSI